MTKGTCLCGNVTFRVAGNLLGQTSACHCGQCRKQTGHHRASANVATAGITVEGSVAWYAASPTAKRGFCSRCGSVLFWKAHGEDKISFSLGALDGPTGLKLERHIFVADKGDYYDIADGLPQLDKS